MVYTTAISTFETRMITVSIVEDNANLRESLAVLVMEPKASAVE